METIAIQEKFKFWIKWTLLSLAIITLSYIISLIVVLLVHGAFGFNQLEGGTYLSQTVMQVAGGAVIGLGTGIYQRALLKKVFNVSLFWVYTLVIGFALTELITCIILWQLRINRYQLRFIENNPLPEALIFACAGLLIGILQWIILKKHFTGSVYWIIASTLGWGICILVIFLFGLLNTQFVVHTFLLGTLLYGMITGATLMWIMQKTLQSYHQ
jgi:hypothetical protein